MVGNISVYQDLHVDVPAAVRPAFREDMISNALPPWRTDMVRAKGLMETVGMDADIILYRRDEIGGLPEAGLTLWSTDTGYYVPNIVPMKTGQLSHTQYNAILQDFVVHVLASVAGKHHAHVRVGKDQETPADWYGEEAAMKLKRFSSAANKSTLAGHPADERRWFDFIVAAHRNGSRPHPDLLARWLQSSEGWDNESAHDLAGEFENCLSLLAFYDNH